MIDKFDYAEPACPFCNGKDFYYPDQGAPLGNIPIQRIIEKVDSCFNKNNYEEAGRLLVFWRDEATELRDKRGELAMESELIGYYRKRNEKEKALASISRALVLIDELGQKDMASGATIYINCATAYKAFDMTNEALPLYAHAEEVYKNTLLEGDARFGGLYNNMALALVDLGKFDEAEDSYNSALAVMENAKGGEPEAAITYINLAHLYEKSGKHDNIRRCLDKAYSLLQSNSIPHDGYYAFVLEKCAPSFGYFGNNEVYEQLKKESELIYERA